MSAEKIRQSSTKVYFDNAPDHEREKISQDLFKKHYKDEVPQIKNSQKQIWLPKAIGIMSENNYMEFFAEILIDLWCSLFKDGQL